METKTLIILLIGFLIGFCFGYVVGWITLMNWMFDKVMLVGNIRKDLQYEIIKRCMSHLGNCM